MTPLLRMTLIAAGLTLLAVVAIHFMRTGSQSGWEALAGALDPAPTVESLETARDIGGSSDAGPWIDYHLAIALFDRAEAGDFERATQVANEALSRNPEHATAQPLRRLLEAVESYSSVSG